VDVDAALGKLLDGLDGDTVCVEVGATQDRLVCASGLADGTDVVALDPDTVCVKVGAALGKLATHSAETTRSAWKSVPRWAS